MFFKECSFCHVIRAIDEFTRDSKSPDGKNYECRSCVSRRCANLYKKNRAKNIAYSMAWKRKNPAKAKAIHLKCAMGFGRFGIVRAGVRARGTEFSLAKIEYVGLISKPCHYCGDYFKNPTEHGVGLDRIDNSVGYKLGNVLPCCGFCNKTRGDRLTVEETKAAIALVLSMRRRLAVANG